MTARSAHTFEFTAEQIREAAKAEAEYHEERLGHWRERAEKALERVKETIGAKVVERQQTNGTVADVIVDYGDPEAWREYQLAHGKAISHQADADRYRTDEKVYGTQGQRFYKLDTDDVHHFRLGGQAREE